MNARLRIVNIDIAALKNQPRSGDRLKPWASAQG